MITDTLNPVMNEDGIIETAVPNKALVPPTPKVEPLKIEAERPPWEDYGALLRSARARSPASRAVIPGAERPPWEDYGALLRSARARSPASRAVIPGVELDRQENTSGIRPEIQALQPTEAPQTLPEQAVTKPPETLPEQAVTKPPETFLGNVKEQWSRGDQSVELDMQAWEAMMGMRSWEEVKAKRDAFKALPPIGENSNLLSKAVQGVAGMLPAIGKGILQGQAAGLTAAVGAGVVGQLGPQIALPEEIITVPGAYAAGVAVGSFEYWARQGTGQIYADLRDANVSHDIAKRIAPIGGLSYAAIELAQIDRIIPGLGRKAKEVVKRTLMKRFLKIALNAGKNIAVESLEEGAQQVVTDTTTAVGKYVAGELKKEDIPDEVKKTALNALDQVYQTIGPMALLQVPGGAVAIKRAIKANAIQGGTNISGIQAKLGAIIQDQTMAGNMDAATTAGRMLKAAKANKLDVLPESHWAAMQRTIIAAATPKPSQTGGSTVVEPTISPEPIPAPAPPPLPLGTPVNGTPGAEMPGAAPVVPETPVLAGTAAKGEAIPAIPAEPRPPPGTPSQEPTGLPPVADAGAGGRVDVTAPVPATKPELLTAVDPNTLIFREKEQHRVEGMRNLDTVDFNPVVLIRESNGENTILDGHNRVVLAKERGDLINSVSLTRTEYDKLKKAGYDDIEISYAVTARMEDASRGDIAGFASEIDRQFPGANVAFRGEEAKKMLEGETAPVQPQAQPATPVEPAIPAPAAAEPVTTAPEPPVQQKGKPQSFMAMEDKGQGPQWVEVPDAKPIRVAGDDVTPGLFIRRVKTPSGKDGEYFIVEPRSGRAIGHGITRKEAVAMAVRNLAPANRAKVIQYTAEWETLNPPKPPAPTAKSSAAIPAPAVAPPAPVVAPVEPAVAPQPPAAKTPEQLTEQRQMLLDIMETRRRNGQPVVKEHRIRLAELDSLLKGETPEAGAVASELVFGHPEATNIGRGKYNHLIPIQVADAASVERFRVRAQQALDGIQTKLSTAEAIVKGTIKGDKKKAKAYLSGQEAVEDSMIRDLLRKETLPELKRLNDVFKGEPGAAPAEAAQGEAPLAPEEPIAPTPENADEVRPELQQGVRVEFDNLDGKGKQPYVIVTREPFDLKNTLVGEVHLTIRNEATGEQVAVEAADISRVLPPREKVPLKQVAEMYQARVEKTPPPAVVKNPALRAAARKVKGAKITVVKSENDIPDTDVRKSMQKQGAEGAQGVFVTKDGSIYVIEDAVPAGREEAVIVHEAVGHFGVRAELGDATPETLLDIYNKATGKMQDVIAKVAKDYGIDLSTEAGKREATEEALGVLAETRSTDPTTWDKIVSGVRKILRKAGFVQEWSENDIQVLLYKAARRAGKEGAYADNIERIQAAYRGEKAAKGNQTLVASNATITAPGAESDLRFMMKAYHGTPHTFEPEPDAPFGKVKKEKVGTGEGAAAYGWGVLYVAGNQEVADSYRKSLSKSINRESDELAIGNKLIKETNWGWDNLAFIDATMRRIKQDGIVRVKEWLTEELDGYKDAVNNPDASADAFTRNRFDVRAQGRIKAIERLIKAASAGTLNVRPAGNLYHIELDFDPEDCLDWDKPLSEQSEEIQSKIQRAIDDGKLNLMAYESTGADIYGGLAMPEALGSQQAASEYLASLGIRGIKYADQGSRTPQIARGANEKFNVMANGQLRSFDTEAEAKTFADSVKTFNFVVFNESDIRVVGRNGETLKPSDAMAGETETMLSRKPQADPFLNQEAQEMHGIVQDKRLTEGFPTKAEAPQREAAKRFYDKDPNAALNALSEGKVSPLTSEGSFIWQYTLDQEGKKAAQSGNPRYGARVMGLMLDYMEVGTEMGRAFHTRHDAMLSPRERNELFLNRAFLQPSSRFMETLGTMAVTEREKALESEFERSQQMRFELMMKLGIDIANLDEATLADPRKIAALVRYKQVKDASIGDKVYEYWRNSILSSLGTLLGANPLGNIANTGWDFSIQRSVEALLNLGFKNPEAAQFGELKYVWKHMLGSSRQLGWQNAVQAWSTEQPVLEGTRYDESGAAISDEYGGRIIRMPQRTLLFADELLKGMTYRSQIISMAYREAVKDGITDEAAIEARIAAAIANPSQAMIEEATKTARELAFQGKLGTIGQMLLKGKHNKNIFIRNLSRYMFPFVTTPMNIVKQGMAKTPIGSLMMVSKAMHGEYKGNQKQLIRDLAEQVIATATTLALLGMVGGDDDEEPWITGTLAWNSPRGQRDQEQKYRPPQSVRIAGRWYSYARIEPFATSMATIVDLIKAMRSAPEKGIDAASYQAFNSVKQQLKDKTFLSSVGDIIRWADKDQGSKTWSENFAASWVPNMFRQGARAFDPYIRNVNDKGPVGKSILRKMLPIPLLQNPPKRDIWGVAIKKGEGPDWPPATDILYRMVVPVRTQLAITPNNIDRMLFNWNNKVSQKVGEKAWWPELPRMSYKKNGKTIEMTPDEYDKFIQYRGEIARKRLMAQYWRDGKAFNEPTKREVERVRDAFAAAGRHAKARLRRELRITGEIKDE